jgi:hypothetical protein
MPSPKRPAVNRATLEWLCGLYGSDFMPKFIYPETPRPDSPAVPHWRSLAPVVPASKWAQHRGENAWRFPRGPLKIGEVVPI